MKQKNKGPVWREGKRLTLGDFSERRELCCSQDFKIFSLQLGQRFPLILWNYLLPLPYTKLLMNHSSIISFLKARMLAKVVAWTSFHYIMSYNITLLG